MNSGVKEYDTVAGTRDMLGEPVKKCETCVHNKLCAIKNIIVLQLTTKYKCYDELSGKAICSNSLTDGISPINVEDIAKICMAYTPYFENEHKNYVKTLSQKMLSLIKNKNPI